ncbi:MAG: hypothetical protein ACQESG_07550 [Nanobdellota archaeon]
MISDEPLFRGTNHHRLHDYLMLLAKSYDRHVNALEQKRFLQHKLKKIKACSRNMGNKQDLLEHLEDLEVHLKEMGHIEGDEEESLLKSLIEQIQSISKNLNSPEKPRKNSHKKHGEADSANDSHDDDTTDEATYDTDESIIHEQRERIKKLEDNGLTDEERLDAIVNKINQLKEDDIV